MSETGEVLTRIEERLGRITLNRPAALNALTLGMIRAIAFALAALEADDTVAAVLIDGAGERGLCAGGDIRAIHDAMVSGDRAPLTFWREEYAINAHIADYRKPLVAIMDGITMGGGIGLSSHASRRVVTDHTTVAMPECAIGFVPDVGGTYLLSRAPGELGTHAALTAGRFKAADVIALDLADVHIPRAAVPDLLEALRGCREAAEVDRAIGALAADPGPSALAAARGWVDRAYAADSVEEIVANLAGERTEGAAQAREAIARMSPTSLKVTLRALRAARRFGDLKASLALEYRVGHAVLGGHDFREGIRAMIIDKDMKPRWEPSTLEAVSPALVDAHFRALGDDELSFPARMNG